MRLRFSIRELLLVTAIVAALVAWWADRKRLEEKMSLMAPPAALVEGRVFYADSGRPAAGVRVYAQGCMQPQFHTYVNGIVKTDDDGRFRFVNLTPGNYNIFAEMIDDWTMIAVEALPVESGRTITGVDVKLVKGGFIKGQVVDAVSGAPNPYGPDGHRIVIGVSGPARPQEGAATQALTVDANGEFRIRVPAGTNYVYPMNVQPNLGVEVDYLCCSHGVVVKDGETTEINIHIKRLAAASVGTQPAQASGKQKQ